MMLWSWWRDQMETFYALLALCAANSPVTGDFPSQKPVTRSFDVFCLICAWINAWVNNRGAGDLRCHGAHYDVIVMIPVHIPGVYNLIRSNTVIFPTWTEYATGNEHSCTMIIWSYDHSIFHKIYPHNPSFSLGAVWQLVLRGVKRSIRRYFPDYFTLTFISMAWCKTAVTPVR